ncbi:MAG: Gfo/Idh/MocA family oxidoreductase, partial [Planctomycetes bacterium]|nr:Gfo/Idh/MocA family oxidoreductase [Planctomycetota bacterium]
MQQPLGFGIIGSGMIARVHARAISELPDCRVAAIFNPRPGGADALAAEFGCPAFTALPDFLAHPGVDAVTVTTPSG